MLSMEMPINSPSNPPQLATKLDVVDVSDRITDIKWLSLNDIEMTLLKVLDLWKMNGEKFVSPSKFEFTNVYPDCLSCSLCRLSSSDKYNCTCDVSTSYVTDAQLGIHVQLSTMKLLMKLRSALLQQLLCLLSRQTFVPSSPIHIKIVI